MSVAIDGNYAIVGAWAYSSISRGVAYIFDVTTGTQVHRLLASDGAGSDYFLESKNVLLFMVIML